MKRILPVVAMLVGLLATNIAGHVVGIAQAQADGKTVVAHNVKAFRIGGLGLGKGGGPNPQAVSVPGLGWVTTTYADLGPSNDNEVKYTITGLSLSTPDPAVVVVQPRQASNVDYGYPDEFAAMVNTTDYDRITVTVKRLDSDGGWGQDLRLDIYIVDWVNN